MQSLLYILKNKMEDCSDSDKMNKNSCNNVQDNKNNQPSNRQLYQTSPNQQRSLKQMNFVKQNIAEVIQVQSSEEKAKQKKGKGEKQTFKKNTVEKVKKQKKMSFKCMLCQQQSKKSDLKSCMGCKKTFHLICLGLDEFCAPKKFTCEKCNFNTKREDQKSMNKKINNSLLQFDKLAGKKNEKEKKKEQQNKKITEFIQRYPFYNLDGKVRFPIQDKLLFIYKDLFQINENMKVNPIQHPIIPSSLLGDFLQIQNFFSTFSDELTQDINVIYKKEAIYQSMDCEGIDEIFKQMQNSLLKIYLKDILQRNKTENVKVLNQNSLFTLFQIISEDQQLNEEFITNVAFEIVKFLGTIPSMKKAFQNFVYPTKYNLNSKLQIILNLIKGMSEVDQFHQFVSRRSDKIQQMTKQRGDLINQVKRDEAESLSNKQRLKQIVSTKSNIQKQSQQNKLKTREAEKEKKKLLKIANQREKTEMMIKQSKQKISIITKNLSFTTTEVLLLGIDRNKSEYFFYVRQPHRIYVRYYEYILSDFQQYRMYEGKQNIIELTKSLQQKGVHQKHLFQNINSLVKDGIIYNKLQDQAIEDERPKKTSIMKQLSIKQVIEAVLQIQRQFTNYLSTKEYQWANQQNRNIFLNKFKNVELVSQLKEYIKQLQDLFVFVGVIRENIDVREGNQIEDYQKNCPPEVKKKVPIKIWGINSEKIKKCWIEYLMSCQGLSAVWICVFVFRNYVNDYVMRKMEYQRQLDKKQEKIKKKQQRQLLKQREKDRQRQRSRQQRYMKSQSEQKSSDNDRPYLRKRQRNNIRKLNMDSDIEDFQDEEIQEESPNEDNCQICGEFGDMICCDTCPKVFHSECLKLKDIPEGQWSCYLCLERISNQRQTRSKVKKTIK